MGVNEPIPNVVVTLMRIYLVIPDVYPFCHCKERSDMAISLLEEPPR